MNSHFARSDAVPEVIVLGAGFSKAVYAGMPTADELGELAVKRAAIEDAPEFDGGRFEMWLSRLAEPQPSLSSAENAENAATFVRVVEAIHAVMAEVQEGFQTLPKWLVRLVTAIHFRRSTVVTFNYDTLVERAVETIGLWDFQLGGSASWELQGNSRRGVYGRANDRGKVGWHSLILDIPPLPPPLRSSAELAPSFRLLKLHGSLNWYWELGDLSGATLYSWHLLDNSEGPLRRHLPGRVPFIVPPAATKSAYFANPIMREIWSTAGRALREAEAMHFVGYSLPVTDQLSSSMIADGLSQTPLDITLVNRAPAEPRKRLKALAEAIPTVVKSVASWADELVLDTARRALVQLQDATAGPAANALAVVGRGPDLWRYVTRVTGDKGRLVLHLTDNAQARTEEIMTVAEIVQAGQHSSHLVARLGRRESPIVGLDGFGRETGPGIWHQVLVPADLPRGEL